jgi:protein-tyrosine phosphatase
MLQPSIYWVTSVRPARLALMPRPRGGDDLEAEVQAWRQADVDLVVSLLEPSEVRELDLHAEASLCAQYGIRFVSFPIRDRGVPSEREASALLAQVHEALVQGQAVAVHCRAGIGRTGLVAGCLLHMLGTPEADLFHVLSRTRGVAVPDTNEQIEWVHRFVRRGARVA